MTEVSTEEQRREAQAKADAASARLAEARKAQAGVFAPKPIDPAKDAQGYKPANPGPDNLREPIADETQNVDHHGRIRELAQELRNASPSGANTISDKILFHLDAIADPKAYNERMATEKKAEDELEAQRAKDRAANKQPVPEKAKV